MFKPNNVKLQIFNFPAINNYNNGGTTNIRYLVLPLLPHLLDIREEYNNSQWSHLD